MSAWIVSKKHIDTLITAALAPTYPGDEQRFCWYSASGTQHEMTPDNADEFGRMLWEECRRSVAFRYPNDADGELPGPNGLTRMQIKRYRFLCNQADPLTVLKAIHCYEYQSCEHPEWNGSIARALCSELRIKMVTRLPGYDAAPWGID